MFFRWRAAESAARSAAEPLPTIRTSVSIVGSFRSSNGTSARGINRSPQRHKGHKADAKQRQPLHERRFRGPLWAWCLCGVFSSFGEVGGAAVEGAVPVAEYESLD